MYDENIAVNFGLVIRKDWLDELGLDVPETYDELHDVLKAFKDKYNCSSAIYMNNNCTITTLTEGYNVATYNVSGSGGAGGSGSSLPYYVEDGVVKCSFIEDGYRDYLTMIHDWYEEGLMDSDFVSIEYDPSPATSAARSPPTRWAYGAPPARASTTTPFPWSAWPPRSRTRETSST